MNKEYSWEKKRKSNQTDEKNQNDEDEQIEKTLNFFDSIIDPYLNDDDNQIHQSTRSNDNSISSVNTSVASSPRYSQLPPQLERKTNVRRHTSDNNLNKIPLSSSKPKLFQSRALRTTATSTEDLSSLPSQTHPSNFIKNSNLLSSNIASASLFDLSSIDKQSSRPRFRFIPPATSDQPLKEEPEIESQFHLKTIATTQTSLDSPNKPSHQIVKPIVIIPPAPKSTPVTRLTETHIHHQNGHSAFKPHQSSKNGGVSSKIQQIKRTESIQKANAQVGLTNSSPRQQRSLPQHHQSMHNLSSSDPAPTNRLAPRISYQSNKTNGYHPSRPMIYEDSIVKRIQQVNNTSSISGLVHPENRFPQQNYPYGSYISTNNGIFPSTNYHRSSMYYHPQYPFPVQSVAFASPPITRNNGFSNPSSSSNVYNFNQNHSPRDGQLRRHSHRQNQTITTYL